MMLSKGIVWAELRCDGSGVLKRFHWSCGWTALRGWRVCVRTLLSPLWGWIISHSYPGLAPWDLLLRRLAAIKPEASCLAASARWVLTHTLKPTFLLPLGGTA